MSKEYVIIFEGGPTPRTTGGALLATLNILNYLAKEHKVTLLCDSRICPDLLQSITDDVTVKILPLRRQSQYKFFNGFIYDVRLLWNFWRLLKNRRVVISTSTNETYPLFSFIKVFRFYHSVSKESHSVSSRLKSFFLSNFLSRARLFAVSQFHKRSLVESLRLNPSRVTVLYNRPFFEPCNHDINTARDFSCINILSVGHVTSYKKPDLWLQIAETLTEKYDFLCFTWVGGGELLSYFQDLTLDNPRIRFVGHKGDLPEYYGCSDLFLHTSEIETHGMSVVEAMSFGLPIVCSNCGGLPESVSHGKNGYLISSHGVEEYANAIECLINDRSKLQSFSRASKEIFDNKFSTDIYEKNLQKYLVNENLF